MEKTFLFVVLTAAGIVNLLRVLRGVWKKTEYTTTGTDAVSEDLARPRLSRYMFSVSLLMILVGIVGLIKVIAK